MAKPRARPDAAEQAERSRQDAGNVAPNYPPQGHHAPQVLLGAPRPAGSPGVVPSTAMPKGNWRRKPAKPRAAKGHRRSTLWWSPATAPLHPDLFEGHELKYSPWDTYLMVAARPDASAEFLNVVAHIPYRIGDGPIPGPATCLAAAAVETGIDLVKTCQAMKDLADHGFLGWDVANQVVVLTVPEDTAALAP